jgi:protein tyrosine phosphatase (PTP) superfamily phosphohydrolase (DUF442 family)
LSAIVLLVLGTIGPWRYLRHNFKRFQEIRPGVIYRMGQPSRHGLAGIVKSHGIRTIACLRYETPRMETGRFFDPGEPSGSMEDAYAAQLGVRFVHWRLGGETHWPWPDPWYLEQFWHLMDEPANYPVLIHCRAGQHRAGTLAAIYRLEYDHWEVRRTLEEMYSFGFGPPRAIQEHNLRTYLPRPHPGPERLQEVLAAFCDLAGGDAVTDFESLVRQLRAQRHLPNVAIALEKYLADEGGFCIGLAQRLIETPDDPLAPGACNQASCCLARKQAAAVDWAASAALIADFGDLDQKNRLLRILVEEAKDTTVTPRYQAVVSGVTSRYTENRIAYLRPLLDDPRQRAEPAARQYRYADTAVARLTSITGGDYLGVRQGASRAAWDRAIEAARAWFDEHSEEADLVPFRPPRKPWWAVD